MMNFYLNPMLVFIYFTDNTFKKLNKLSSVYLFLTSEIFYNGATKNWNIVRVAKVFLIFYKDALAFIPVLMFANNAALSLLLGWIIPI